jgi:uncharacterized membrane protein
LEKKNYFAALILNKQSKAMKIILNIFALLSFLCLQYPVFAQLSIRNEHDRPIQVAVAYLEEDGETKKWVSEGWFSVESETVELLKEKITTRYYYLYIVDNNNNEWGGEGFQLMVDEVNKFTITKADKKYISQENKTYKMHSFMEIDTGGSAKEFTFVFKGKQEATQTEQK